MKGEITLNKQSNIPSDSVEYNYLNASSTQDCTGLIPSAIQDDEELESYKELYPFLPNTEDQL